jgi:hypothetical protein
MTVKVAGTYSYHLALEGKTKKRSQTACYVPVHVGMKEN